jgi:hypothetical protein
MNYNTGDNKQYVITIVEQNPCSSENKIDSLSECLREIKTSRQYMALLKMSYYYSLEERENCIIWTIHVYQWDILKELTLLSKTFPTLVFNVDMWCDQVGNSSAQIINGEILYVEDCDFETGTEVDEELFIDREALAIPLSDKVKAALYHEILRVSKSKCYIGTMMYLLRYIEKIFNNERQYEEFESYILDMSQDELVRLFWKHLDSFRDLSKFKIFFPVGEERIKLKGIYSFYFVENTLIDNDYIKPRYSNNDLYVVFDTEDYETKCLSKGLNQLGEKLHEEYPDLKMIKWFDNLKSKMEQYRNYEEVDVSEDGNIGPSSYDEYFDS